MAKTSSDVLFKLVSALEGQSNKRKNKSKKTKRSKKKKPRRKKKTKSYKRTYSKRTYNNYSGEAEMFRKAYPNKMTGSSFNSPISVDQVVGMDDVIITPEILDETVYEHTGKKKRMFS